jgi:hypothetical protein
MSRLKSFHETAADAYMTHLLGDPAASAALIETRESLRRHRFPIEYVRVIAQADARAGDWPMEQVAAFLSVHAGLNSGKYARVDIDLLEVPWPDDERVKNAAVLAELPPPFHGWVDPSQNCSPGGDGIVSWTEPIHCQRSTGLGSTDGDGSTRPIVKECMIRALESPNWGIPLEIGSTKASVTAMHLLHEQAVARWPYGSTVLTVLVNTEAYGPPAGTQQTLAGLS